MSQKMVKILLGALLLASFSHAEEKKTAHAKGGKEEKEGAKEKFFIPPPGSANSLIPSNKYVNNWIPMPELKGENLDGAPLKYQPTPSKISVYVFTASWCVQCQMMMDYVQRLEKLYADLSVEFEYVFAHDLAQDAKAFAQTYNIDSNNCIVATHDILKAFHNPDLPAVFVKDRNGWLLFRAQKISVEDINKLEALIFSQVAN